jgi:hypothetical protein
MPFRSPPGRTGIHAIDLPLPTNLHRCRRPTPFHSAPPLLSAPLPSAHPFKLWPTPISPLPSSCGPLPSAHSRSRSRPGALREPSKALVVRQPLNLRLQLRLLPPLPHAVAVPVPVAVPHLSNDAPRLATQPHLVALFPSYESAPPCVQARPLAPCSPPSARSPLASALARIAFSPINPPCQ